MKKLIIAAAVAGMFAVEAVAGEFARREMAYGDTMRTYTIYRPDSINRFAPLVVYTHGYGSKTRNRKDLNRAADRHGFVVCYPDGAPDTRGKDGWYVGYPSQSNMDKDEISFFKALLDEVCTAEKLNRDNVFMAGMSNGAMPTRRRAGPAIMTMPEGGALTYPCLWLWRRLRPTTDARRWRSTR